MNTTIKYKGNFMLLPRGVEKLDQEQTKWRVLKIREILNVNGSCPYIYEADPSLPNKTIPPEGLAQYILDLGERPIYIHFHRNEIFKVRRYALKGYWGEGLYYCTIFDSTFEWFIFTDDNDDALIIYNKKCD